MLAEFFESALRIQELRDGPDGRVLEGFAPELCQAGYAEITARRHIRAAEHLIHWLGRKGRTVAALDERTIEEFVHHLNRCRCPRYGRTHMRDIRKGARLFLRYARFADIVTTRIVEEVIVDPALLVKIEPAPPMESSEHRPAFRSGKPGGHRGGQRSGRPGGGPGGGRSQSRRGGSQRSGR